MTFYKHLVAKDMPYRHAVSVAAGAKVKDSLFFRQPSDRHFHAARLYHRFLPLCLSLLLGVSPLLQKFGRREQKGLVPLRRFRRGKEILLFY